MAPFTPNRSSIYGPPSVSHTTVSRIPPSMKINELSQAIHGIFAEQDRFPFGDEFLKRCRP